MHVFLQAVYAMAVGVVLSLIWGRFGNIDWLFREFELYKVKSGFHDVLEVLNRVALNPCL